MIQISSGRSKAENLEERLGGKVSKNSILTKANS